MKRKGGIRKRGQKSLLRKKTNLWIYILVIVLFLMNLILLDTLLGIKIGWHFLPKPIFTPFSNFFTHKALKKTKPSAREAIEIPAPDHKFTAKTSKRAKEKYLMKPSIALVIDDLGYNPDLAEDLFTLGYSFTVSILPNLPYSKFIAQRAIENGKEVILHLPMEPYDYPNIRVEKETLLTSMEDEEIRRSIKKALHDLGYAVGANNHMGSRMVENEDKMGVVLDEMKKNGLFFLDSRTSPRSLVNNIAHRIGVKCIERDVFLDGESDIDYIHKQLEKVVELAKSNGYGIAIGHLHPKTILALKTFLPQLHKKGVELVKLSEVIE